MRHESKGAHFRSDFPNADYTDPVGLVIDILRVQWGLVIDILSSPNPFRKLLSLLNFNIILIESDF